MAVSGGTVSQSTAAVIKIPPCSIQSQNNEVEFVKCDCCGLTEECTQTYILKVRDKYQGRWICGLCTEAVKDEIFRSSSSEEEDEKKINTEEALNRHMNFCNNFRSSTPPSNPTKHLISAMKQLCLRSLDSPTRTTTRSSLTSSTSSPDLRNQSSHDDHPRLPPPLTRSGSCFPTLTS